MEATHGTADEQAKLWNGVAAEAWVEAQPLLDRLLKPFEDLLVNAVASTSRGPVLDVGCGTGGTTLAFARLLGAEGRCVGIDISEPMIAFARERAEREQLPVLFISGDAQVHAFEPASVDMIVSRFGVMFFDHPVRALANLRRAAMDHATLRFIVWRSAEENPFMTTAERAAAPFLPDLPVRQPDAPGQFAFANQQRVYSILKEGGWAEIDISAIDVDCTMSEKELAGYVTRFGPVGRILHEADETTRARLSEIVRAAFDPFVHGAEARFTAACWMISGRARA